MTRIATHWIASLVGGFLAGGAVYWGGVESLAVPVGLCVVIAGLLLFRLKRDYPGRETGGHWSDDRWGGISAPVLGAVVGPGIYSLSLDLATTFALGILVGLVGVVGYVGGILDEAERGPGRQRDDDTSTAAVDG